MNSIEVGNACRDCVHDIHEYYFSKEEILFRERSTLKSVTYKKLLEGRQGSLFFRLPSNLRMFSYTKLLNVSHHNNSTVLWEQGSKIRVFNSFFGNLNPASLKFTGGYRSREFYERVKQTSFYTGNRLLEQTEFVYEWEDLLDTRPISLFNAKKLAWAMLEPLHEIIYSKVNDIDIDADHMIAEVEIMKYAGLFSKPHLCNLYFNKNVQLKEHHVLHEIAHLLDYLLFRGNSSHGPSFTKIYSILLEEALGIIGATRSMKNYGLLVLDDVPCMEELGA